MLIGLMRLNRTTHTPIPGFCLAANGSPADASPADASSSDSPSPSSKIAALFMPRTAGDSEQILRLGQIPGFTPSIDETLSRLTQDRKVSVRDIAITALESLGDLARPARKQILTEALKTEKKPRVLRSILLGLQSIKPSQDIPQPTLNRLGAQKPYYDLAKLEYERDSEQGSQLIDKYHTDENHELRELAAEQIPFVYEIPETSIETKQRLKEITFKLLLDPRTQVRLAAFYSLCKIYGPDTFKVHNPETKETYDKALLIRLITKEKDPYTRSKMIEHLQYLNIDKKDRKELLIEIAKSQRSLRTRLAVAEALTGIARIYDDGEHALGLTIIAKTQPLKSLFPNFPEPDYYYQSTALIKNRDNNYDQQISSIIQYLSKNKSPGAVLMLKRIFDAHLIANHTICLDAILALIKKGEFELAHSLFKKFTKENVYKGVLDSDQYSYPEMLDIKLKVIMFLINKELAGEEHKLTKDAYRELKRSLGIWMNNDKLHGDLKTEILSELYTAMEEASGSELMEIAEDFSWHEDKELREEATLMLYKIFHRSQERSRICTH